MPVVENTLKDPAGTVIVGAKVQIRLIADVDDEAAGFISASKIAILGVWSAETDATGKWSLTLEANADLLPANTYYEVTELAPGRRGVVNTISVPTTAGPHKLYNILVAAPSSITPAGVGVLASANVWTNYQDHQEIATPGTPPANTGREFFRDNGSGKTEYVIKWPSGNETVIATDF